MIQWREALWTYFRSSRSRKASLTSENVRNQEGQISYPGADLYLASTSARRSRTLFRKITRSICASPSPLPPTFGFSSSSSRSSSSSSVSTVDSAPLLSSTGKSSSKFGGREVINVSKHIASRNCWCMWSWASVALAILSFSCWWQQGLMVC